MATVDLLAAFSLSCLSVARGAAVAMEGVVVGLRGRGERAASHRLCLSGLGEGRQQWTGTAWRPLERRSGGRVEEMVSDGAMMPFGCTIHNVVTFALFKCCFLVP